MQTDSAALSDALPRRSLWKRLVEYLDWKMNPVLLRDLRLYARGKLMLAAYFLTLVILVLVAIAFALSARWSGKDGAGLLYVPTVLLSLICGALIPNLVAERFRSELKSRATELALASPLTAGRLVRGKLFGAWGLSMLVASTAAPVFATAYMLGGVNHSGIFGVGAGILLAGAVMPLPQLCLATNSGKQGGRILFTLVFVVNIILMFSYSSLLYNAFVEVHPYIRMANYAALASSGLAAVLIAQFLYFVTVSRLRPEAENREAAPRKSLAVAALLGGVGAFVIFIVVERSGGLYSTGGDFSEALAIACLPVSYAFCWGIDTLSHFNAAPPLIAGERWRGKPVRRLFFGAGPRGVTAFFLLITAVLLLVSFHGIWNWDDWDSDRYRVLCLTLIPIMVVMYGLLAFHYVVRPLLRKRPGPNVMSYTISLSNAGLAAVAIFIMVLASGIKDLSDFNPILFGTTPVGMVIGVFESTRRASEIAWVGVLVVVVQFIALLPYLFRRADASGRGERSSRPGQDGNNGVG